MKGNMSTRSKSRKGGRGVLRKSLSNAKPLGKLAERCDIRFYKIRGKVWVLAPNGVTIRAGKYDDFLYEVRCGARNILA